MYEANGTEDDVSPLFCDFFGSHLINIETALIALILRPKKEFFCFLQKRTQPPLKALKTKVLSFLLCTFLVKTASIVWKAVYNPFMPNLFSLAAGSLQFK